MFKACGLDILESKEFKSIEEAVSYVQGSPAAYVVKVSGKAQDDKSLTYVSQTEDGSDVVAVLEHMGKKMDNGVASVEVQEKVEGLEIGVGGIFNGEKFVGPIELDWEHKALLPWKTQKGIGPLTGEMGTVSLWADQDTPLFQKVIAPMVKPLKAVGFKGFFNVNCIVEEDGTIRPLETTCRFGWPTLPMEIETMKENDLGQFFFDVASGKDCTFEVTYPWSVCVVIGLPPLPFMNDEIFEKYSKDMPVMFRDGQAPEGIYPGEAKIEDDQWRVAGSSGCLAVAAAGGYSIEECQEAAYEIAEQVIAPNRMIRDDIGRTVQESYDQLQEMGLIGVEEEDLVEDPI
jgi:phosphoribosylamine--glycine ligase